MDLRELKRIIRLVEDSAIEELEIEQEGVRIRVRKGSGITQTYLADRALPAPQYFYDPQRAGTPVAPGSVSEPIAEASEAAQSATAIKSPMVGTFYRSPSPDSPPFVQVGSLVQPDTVVCILEAMKVMNEIKAGVQGKISEILVENSTPVEFGQPMFRVIPG
jgi:acetyl-CoA carboxylase biotin carboxyl carrier protein